MTSGSSMRKGVAVWTGVLGLPIVGCRRPVANGDLDCFNGIGIA